ncbi:MAG: tetraacyldisaccharide 4'-kinase, partial [bacterium]
TVVRELRFRDHHAFRAEDLAPLREDDREEPTDLWLTTEKDALKILPKWVRPAVLQVLEIEAEIEAEDALLDEIEEVLREMGRLGRT